jgi:hypothetical protein
MVYYNFDYEFNLVVPEDLYDYANERFSGVIERCVKPHCVKLDNMTILSEWDLPDDYYNDTGDIPDFDVWQSDRYQIDEFFNVMEKEFL